MMVALDAEDCHRRVRVTLMQAGYTVVSDVSVDSIHQAPSKALVGCDALIFDAGKRGEAGVALCRRLRECHVVVPQLVIASSAGDLLPCLKAGAIDGMVAPLRLQELVARVRAAIRSYAHVYDRILQVGPFLFDPTRREIGRPGDRTSILLTELEAKVFKALLAARGQTVSPARLLQEVWHYHPNARTHTVETVIYRLRKKLETGIKQYQLLETINGDYRLNALSTADER
jgi:DNA-binding response OmpR family regulator